MKKLQAFFVLSFFILALFACKSPKIADSNTKSGTYLSEIQGFQKELNKGYKNPKESPLEDSERRKFKSLPFFNIDESYKVDADFVRTNDEKIFQMQTTTDRKPIYKKFGEVRFELLGKRHTLNVYQSQDLMKQEKYKNYLFLPFTDLSNGQESYYAGRYIDLEIPAATDGQNLEKITIDFNKAYNPYCAYNKKYSCPIPPKENHLEVKILAGVRYDNHD